MTLKPFTGEAAATAELAWDQPEVLLDAYVNEVKKQHQGKLCTKIKPKDYSTGEAILSASPEIQLAVMLTGAGLLVKECFRDSQRDFAIRQLLTALFRKELPYNDDALRQLFRIIKVDLLAVSMLPIGMILTNLQRYSATHGLRPAMREGLETLASKLSRTAYCAEERKHGSKIAAILESASDVVPETRFEWNTGEAWTDALLVELGKQDDVRRSHWRRLLEHCHGASQPKPSKKWLKEASTLLELIGTEAFVAVLCRLLSAIGQPGKSQKHDHGGFVFYGDPTEIHDTHADTLRGLIWATSLCDDETLISHVGDAAEKSFQKVPNVGPRSPKIGNACLIALSSVSNTAAVAQLGRLKSRAKHASTRNQITKAFDRAAANAGMTADDLEELAVPAFGMSEVGRYAESLGDFIAEVIVPANAKSELRWLKPNGERQKSAPAAVKSEFADKLKAIRKKVKDIDTLMPSIRFRLEQLFLADRKWSLADFRQRYIDQPLVGINARRLIWNFSSEKDSASAIWREGEFVDSGGRPVAWITEETEVSLWHPLQEDADEVLRWRERLEAQEITQPFKQAHREVYVLTDAERTTNVYSNRFASHIIRQHQFAALCQQRGWRYRLQGDFDSANTPYLDLPRHNLKAQYFVEPIEGLAVTTDHMIYLNLSTDQVRFCGSDGYMPLPLQDIPPIVFSEVMRDVDLFVGVTSIGNDPNWGGSAGGDPHDDYWRRVSFGDLSATAETRANVLQRIVPRLKIAEQCRFEGRFLIVTGKLHEYKIHLGSGNVLMSPNDRYLCIVQKHGGGTKQTENIYLPFEGDAMLAMILSKAFLLAADDKIKEPSILGQIQLAGERDQE